MAARRTRTRSRRPEPRHGPCPPLVDAGERGQASVEFVALLPVLVLVALALGQAAVAGYAQWSAAASARVAARAEALGHDGAAAARSGLPAMLRRGSHVRRVAERPARGGRPAVLPGTVEVRLPVPALLPGLSFGTVRSRAQLPGQAGA